MAKRDHTTTIQGVLRGSGLTVPDDQIYAGMVHEGMPDICITMSETGGPGATGMMGTTESVQHPTVQVRVRHTDKTDGKSDADDVWEILQNWEPGPDYQNNEKMLQSTALPMGQDDGGRYEWAINVELFISE